MAMLQSAMEQYYDSGALYFARSPLVQDLLTIQDAQGYGSGHSVCRFVREIPSTLEQYSCGALRYLVYRILDKTKDPQQDLARELFMHPHTVASLGGVRR